MPALARMSSGNGANLKRVGLAPRCSGWAHVIPSPHPVTVYKFQRINPYQCTGSSRVSPRPAYRGLRWKDWPQMVDPALLKSTARISTEGALENKILTSKTLMHCLNSQFALKCFRTRQICVSRQNLPTVSCRAQACAGKLPLRKAGKHCNDRLCTTEFDRTDPFSHL